MSFKDIFKSSFIEGFQNEIGTKTIVVCLAITLVISFFVFLVYRIVTRKTFYSQTFAISLIAMSVITAAAVLTIQTSIVVSLGMVGALSIVRFRTAIKDPLDLVFLFWSICVGIICGAGVAQLAVILSIVVAICIIVLQNIPSTKQAKILLINSSDIESEDKIVSIIKSKSKYYKVKSRTITNTTFDMVVEIRTSNEKEILKDLIEIDAIESAVVMDHDGEVTM